MKRAPVDRMIATTAHNRGLSPRDRVILEKQEREAIARKMVRPSGDHTRESPDSKKTEGDSQ